MSRESGPIPREFLLKQIENEIKSGFALVEAARKAYKQRQPEQGDGALEQAAYAHQHASQQITTSVVGQMRSISHQLAELREAIDWLRESIVPTSK